jgi:hypothetical protein
MEEEKNAIKNDAIIILQHLTIGLNYNILTYYNCICLKLQLTY